MDLALAGPVCGIVRAEPPRRHRRLRARRSDLQRAFLPVAVVSAVSAIATAASPALRGHPLVLAALSPRLPFLALAATGTPLWGLLAVALPRSLLTDPIYFAIGRRHGAAALTRLPGRGARLARLAAMSTPMLVLVRPVGRHLLLAGAGRSRPGIVALADVVGTAAYLAAVHAAAHAVG